MELNKRDTWKLRGGWNSRQRSVSFRASVQRSTWAGPGEHLNTYSTFSPLVRKQGRQILESPKEAPERWRDGRLGSFSPPVREREGHNYPRLRHAEECAEGKQGQCQAGREGGPGAGDEKNSRSENQAWDDEWGVREKPGKG